MEEIRQYISITDCISYSLYVCSLILLNTSLIYEYYTVDAISIPTLLFKERCIRPRYITACVTDTKCIHMIRCMCVRMTKA